MRYSGIQRTEDGRRRTDKNGDDFYRPSVVRPQSLSSQDREAFARMALCQQDAAAFAFVESFDEGAARPPAARCDHCTDRLRVAGQDRLDRAVAAVAHPALDAVHRRGILDEHAEADALHPSAHAHMTNDAAHPISPVATPSVPRKPGIHRASPTT